jgi:hypothetical protein
MRCPLYYVQYKTGFRPEDTWQNLVAFPMPWSKAQELFPALGDIAGEDHPLRIVDCEAE